MNPFRLTLTALSALLLGCGSETNCGAGTHLVVGDDGDGTCFPDADSAVDATDSDETGDTGDTGEALDPTVPRDPENPYANCARLVTGTYAEGGVVSYVFYIEYDAEGDWVIQKKDGNANGSYEENWSAEYTDDRTQMVYDYDDDDGDTTVDARYLFNYRSDGQVDTSSWDTEADGAYEVVNTYSYDDADRVIGREYDYGPDETPDGVETWTWSETGDGLSSRDEWDYPLDGIVDYVVVETYNATPVEDSPVGQKIGREVDSDGDGVNEYVYSYEYDADGRQWAYDLVVYDAGVFSYSYRMESTFDAWGRWESSAVVYDDANSAYDYDITDEYSCW